MREQKSIPTEYPDNWDTGMYQTGPSKPKNRQSVAITVLLMLVIFLGGMASALGVMNIHLLQKLIRQENEQLSLSVDGTQGTVMIEDNFFHSDHDMEIQLPEEEVLELRLGIRVQELNALCRQYWELSSGVEVVAVEEGKQLQEGDILVSLNGERINDLSQLYHVVNEAPRGQILSLGVLRAGRQLTVDMTVEDP